MGNAPSAEELECVGYRVLGVQDNSPASKVGLVSFFDFIVAANGVPLRALDNTFIEMIKASEEKPLPLTVFNYKAMASRDVVLVPSKHWPGQGMLGVTIRFDNYFNADENVVRVLEVQPGSPAQIAGLQSETDYILGTAEKAFRDPDSFLEELVQSLEQPMEIFIYNTESDEVRTCVILPSRKWGGEGCLGCDVGSGYIHKLPAKSRGTTGISISTVKYNPHPVAGDSFHPPPALAAGSQSIPQAPSSQTREVAHNMFPPNRPSMSQPEEDNEKAVPSQSDDIMMKKEDENSRSTANNKEESQLPEQAGAQDKSIAPESLDPSLQMAARSEEIIKEALVPVAGNTEADVNTTVETDAKDKLNAPVLNEPSSKTAAPSEDIIKEAPTPVSKNTEAPTPVAENTAHINRTVEDISEESSSMEVQSTEKAAEQNNPGDELST
mmetsp:Transcript_7952/g.10589  ORF Transcript_7952/g.10589 Transcript_7952/m.10589 type:complete len:439 (+) Transcript_7952:172-1488(+)|eukprot:CAMPEP_0117753470 /NCGR_PEP_ID=MMETSP0947-20121206/12244_1 /TAXON_ID=44440 /ORGANISM="Chattonella subsalsa, Strain CCMP2191" /LENGTH=438 /DNA_ID=CAMNT_0005572357 /DNA_START=104 /DNA_END=1420 /DNA_ORIENTATION=+